MRSNLSSTGTAFEVVGATRVVRRDPAELALSRGHGGRAELAMHLTRFADCFNVLVSGPFLAATLSAPVDHGPSLGPCERR